jgi:hypothetical protein
MGFFDTIKQVFGGSKPPPAPPTVSTLTAKAKEAAHQNDVLITVNGERFDTAGFDWDRDENAFFEAVRRIEGAGEGDEGATDEERLELYRRYGIRNHSHFLTVKESVYAALVAKYGSQNVVSQRQWDYESGRGQSKIRGAIAKKQASGDLAPVEGISLEQWAAINAAIIGGANYQDLLKGNGIEEPRWDRAKTEWEARMARDTTFAIATAYGDAFQNASKGKYAAYAKEANLARAANRDVNMDLPMTLQQYYDILFEQSYATAAGEDATEVLKRCGLTLTDYIDLSSFMGYYWQRTCQLKQKEYAKLLEDTTKKFDAKYPGVKAQISV